MDTLLTVFYILASILAILIPLYLIFRFSKKYSVPLDIAISGMIFFVIVQIIHIPIVFLTQGALGNFFNAEVGEFPATVLVIFYLAFLAALFEEIGRYLVYKKMFKSEDKNEKSAIVFGLGWGGIESIIFVGLLMIASYFAQAAFFDNTDLVAYKSTLIQQGLTWEQADQQMVLVEQQKVAFQNQDSFNPLYSLVERLGAITLHVCNSVLVMRYFIKSDKKGLLKAILAHGAANFIAVLVANKFGVLTSEISLLVVVVALWFYVFRTRKTSLDTANASA